MNFPIDVIYDQGVLRPLEPLVLPQGTRVRVRLEDRGDAAIAPPPARIVTPRLVHPEQAADFVMQVIEVPNAGV